MLHTEINASLRASREQESRQMHRCRDTDGKLTDRETSRSVCCRLLAHTPTFPETMSRTVASQREE